MNYEPLYTFAEKHRVPYNELCTALRAALAAPQPEPVALCDALRWSGAKESHGAMMFSPNQLRKFYEFASRAAPPAAPAPADWGTPHDVSGAPWGAPAPAVCDGGTCGLGGYCTNCPRLSAAPAVPPPIDNRFVAPGCEQFGTRADAESLLTMLRATLDEYMRLAAAPAVPRPDEFTCPYCFDQGAAPAVPLTDEQQIAIREAHCNTASDEYFGARPQVDDATKRRTYEAGFKEGWESGIGGGGNG